MPSGAPKDWCLSGCPKDRVRIGLGYDKKCANFSYRALCCVPHMTDIIQIENPVLDEYRDALDEYLKDPTCENPGFATRDVHPLSARAEKSSTRSVQALLLALIVQTASNSLLDMTKEIWNKAMKDYKNLQFPGLRDYIKSTEAYRVQGPIQISSSIVCSPSYWNTLASKTEEEKLICIDGICDHQSCTLPNLNSRSNPLIRRHHSHHKAHHSHNKVIKRVGPARDYSVELPGGTITITLPAVGSFIIERLRIC